MQTYRKCHAIFALNDSSAGLFTARQANLESTSASERETVTCPHCFSDSVLTRLCRDLSTHFMSQPSLTRVSETDLSEKLSHLGRGFKPSSEAMVFTELVHLGRTLTAFLLLVTLVSQEDSRDGAAIGKVDFTIQITFPF